MRWLLQTAGVVRIGLKKLMSFGKQFSNRHDRIVDTMEIYNYANEGKIKAI